MRIALGLSFFDNVKEIPRCLGDPKDKTAICNNVDVIIGIDGRYDGYDADHNYSIDGSYELFSKYPEVILEKYHGYQTEKRQRYLDIAGELKCDYLIVVDSDEYLHPDYKDWRTFYSNLFSTAQKYPEHKLFKMQIWLDKNWERAWNMFRRNRFQNFVRIHKNPGTQRYCVYTHYYWCDKRVTDEMLAVMGSLPNDLMLKEYAKPIDGVRLSIDSKLRNEETLWLRDKWAWDTTHEENRRQYILIGKHYYHQKDIPENINEFLHYDEGGKPVQSNPIVNQ